MTETATETLTAHDLHGMRFRDLLGIVDDPRRDTLLRIYDDHRDLFEANPGSSHIHQAWPGGLEDHLADLFRLATLSYRTLCAFVALRDEALPFTLGSALVAIFCHDAEKVVVYGSRDDPRCAPFFEGSSDPSEKETKEGIKWEVIAHWGERYGLRLTDAEINAVRYTHGEGADYRNDRRVMNELAAFVGNVDRTSARILYASGRDLG